MICVCFSCSVRVNIGLAAELDVWTVYSPSSIVKMFQSGGVVIGDVLSGRYLEAAAGAFIHCLLGLDYYRIHGTVFQIQPWTMDGVSSGMYSFMLQIIMVVLRSLFSMN